MVQRIRCLKKKPYWDKNIMTELGLNNTVSLFNRKSFNCLINVDDFLKKKSTIAIVANTPPVNALLWKVKHLIKITPVTFPNVSVSKSLPPSNLILTYYLIGNTWRWRCSRSQAQGKRRTCLRTKTGERCRCARSWNCRETTPSRRRDHAEIPTRQVDETVGLITVQSNLSHRNQSIAK